MGAFMGCEPCVERGGLGRSHILFEIVSGLVVDRDVFAERQAEVLSPVGLACIAKVDAGAALRVLD
jgi:hypothetical protein